jgi:hypothetical protein
MSRLPPFILKNRCAEVATATVATPATVGERCSNNSRNSGSKPPATKTPDPAAVATIASVAVAAAKVELSNSWSAEAQRWRDAYEEKAAIREHCGGLPRVEAEAAALNDLAGIWRSENPLPASDRAVCCHCDKPDPCTPVLARNGHAWMHARCWPPLNSAREKLAREAITLALGTAVAIAPKTNDAGPQAGLRQASLPGLC